VTIYEKNKKTKKMKRFKIVIVIIIILIISQGCVSTKYCSPKAGNYDTAWY